MTHMTKDSAVLRWSLEYWGELNFKVEEFHGEEDERFPRLHPLHTILRQANLKNLYPLHRLCRAAPLKVERTNTKSCRKFGQPPGYPPDFTIMIWFFLGKPEKIKTMSLS